MPYDAAARAEAKAYVATIRAKTVCDDCGGQPVEFHNEEHEDHPNRRVAHLVALGFPIARIQAEIAASEALCRRCHMKRDGRLDALVAARPRKKGDVVVGLLPCEACGTPAKPLRKGLCNRCNHRKRAGTL